MRVEITRFRVNTIMLERNDIIAHFNVRVGDFHIKAGTLRVPHDGGDPFISMPGRKTAAIAIADPSETRDDILDAVVARFRAETGRAP